MKKLTITFLMLFSVLIWHAHARAAEGINGGFDGAKQGNYIITLLDFDKPLGADGYSLESAWGQVEHGVVDNPNPSGINTSEKVYMGKREAGSWNSGIKFVFDEEVTNHGKSLARLKVHPQERPTYVYLKFLDGDDVTLSEGWCTMGTFPEGQWSYAKFNENISGVSFKKIEIYFSDSWGETTAEATTYLDHLQIFNEGDEYPEAGPQRNEWAFDDPDDLGINHEKTAGDAVYEDGMLKMTITEGLPWQEPCVWTEYMDTWSPEGLQYFWMRIKNESAGNHVGFTAIGGDDWFGLHRVDIPTNDDMFRDVIIDITDPARWWSPFPENLNEIRFDGPKGVEEGVYWVDFYRFVEDFPESFVEEITVSAPYTTAYGMTHRIPLSAEVSFKESVVSYVLPRIVWSVSDESIATVSDEGILTPVAEGSVTVYAGSELDPSLQGSIDIEVMESDTRVAWEFEDPDDTGLDLERTAGEASFENGMLKMTIVEGLPWQEPCVWTEHMDTWSMEGLNYFWMRIKNESEGNDVGFTATAGDDWYGLHRVKMPVNDNMFRDVIIDISDPDNWWSNFPENLNRIRFDGPKGVDEGVYWVDFYRFVEDFPKTIHDVKITAPLQTAYGLDHHLQLEAELVFDESVVAYVREGITWRVSDEDIGTVDEDGLFSPVSDGEVTVFASSAIDPEVEGSITITVLEDYVVRTAWEFDDPDDTGLDLDHEWAAGIPEIADGMLKVTLVPDMPWNEPNVWSEHMEYWPTDDLNYFWMRIKNESAGNEVGFTAQAGDDWYGLHRVDIPTNDDMFREVIIDLTDPDNWWSDFPKYLNQIRFDGPRGVDEGAYYVDYYRFVEEFPFADAVEDVVISSRFTTAYGLDHLIQFYADVTFEEHIVAYIKTGVTWSVSDEAIATISEGGLLTPVAAGEVTVYATSKMNPDVAGSVEITVLESYEFRTAWEFDDPDDTGLDLDHDWAAGIPVIQDGMLQVTLVPDMPWQEPNVWSEYMDYWTLGDLKYFWMRIKNQSEGNGVGFTARFGEDWYGVDRVDIPTNADEFTDVLIDLTDPESWWGDIPQYINEIRFDGPRGVDEGVYYVDFYRFLTELPPAESIVVSSPFDEVYGIGSSVTLEAVVYPTVASQDVTWSVDNEEIAEIDAETGKLTAVSAGEVVVTATARDLTEVTGTKTINIFEESMPVSSITVMGEDGRTVIIAGTSLQMMVEVLPLNATNQEVTYSIDNEEIASIDAETGLLTGMVPGTVVVTATALDGSGVSNSLEIDIIEQIMAWEFDDAEGWDIGNAVNANANVQDGKLIIEVTGENPQVPGEVMDYWQVFDNEWVEIRIKNETPGTRGKLTAITQNDEEMHIYFPLESDDTQFRNVLVNLTGVSGWEPLTVVSQFRIDAVDDASTGMVTIDYIRFLETRPATILSANPDETTILPFVNYNDGGPGVGYVDSDPTNNGGAYRPHEGVDISGGHGRYEVGWTDPGERLYYDIYVQEPGLYHVTFNFTVIHGWFNEKFTVMVNDDIMLSQVELPAPADFVPYSLDTSMTLMEGQHVLAFVINEAAGGFNLGDMVFRYEGFMGNNDASLKAIYIGGEPLPNFAPNILQYRVDLPADADRTIEVELSDPNASYEITEENGSITIVVTAEDGTTTRTYFIRIVVDTTSIDMVDTAGINVYPNPASSILYVTEADNALLEVYSMIGRLVHRSVNNDNIAEIDVSGFDKGLYLLKVTKNEETFVTRFMVK